MVLRSIKPRNYLHQIINLLLLLSPGLIQPHLLTNIQQLSLNHKLLPLDPLAQLMIVNINQTKFHRLLLLSIVVVKLHLGQKELGVVIVLYLKITTTRHKTHHLSRILALLIRLINSHRCSISISHTLLKLRGLPCCCFGTFLAVFLAYPYLYIYVSRPRSSL